MPAEPLAELVKGACQKRPACLASRGCTHNVQGPEGQEAVAVVTVGPGIPARVVPLLQAKPLSIEDEVSYSCLLTSSDSTPVLSPTSLCPSYSVLCPHPRKHPWKASRSALEPRWTTPAHGHPRGAGQCQTIPFHVEAQSLSAPLLLPRFQHGSFARVPRFPSPLGPSPKVWQVGVGDI